MGNEMVVHQGGQQALARVPILEPSNLQELQQLGTLMAQSGFFQDARQAAQACVKILAGREMGFPPIASMTGISIIDGKPATGANLLAAAMKRAGYTWRVLQRDAKGCRLVVSFRGTEVGPSEFLEEDAKRADLLGKKNWSRWPRSMYFARAISDAARTYAPEVFAGIPPYTADELGAENTTEDGAPIVETIDTGGHPVGTKAAAQHVAQQKIQQLSAQEPAQKPAAKPESQQKGESVKSSSRGDKGADDPRNDAAPLTEEEQLAKRWAAADTYERLRMFGELKKDLHGVTGDDAEYYRILLDKGGVDHANQFKSRAKAWVTLIALFRSLKAHTAAVTIEPSSDSMTPEQFVEGLEPAGAQ